MTNQQFPFGVRGQGANSGNGSGFGYGSASTSRLTQPAMPGQQMGQPSSPLTGSSAFRQGVHLDGILSSLVRKRDCGGGRGLL